MFTCCCFSPLPPSCPLVALVSLLAEWGGFGRVWGAGAGGLQGKHTLSNPSLRARSDGPGGHEKPCGRTWLPDQWWQEERRLFPHMQSDVPCSSSGEQVSGSTWGRQGEGGKREIRGHERFRRPAGSCAASPAGLGKARTCLNASVGVMQWWKCPIALERCSRLA